LVWAVIDASSAERNAHKPSRNTFAPKLHGADKNPPAHCALRMPLYAHRGINAGDALAS